jgi:hypothetical protein
MADSTDLEGALDELFATPPEDFVAARNGLVKALKAAGQKDDAAEVTALRKPNRLVWAVDQLALTDDPALAPLLDAADAVREGGADDLRAAIADLREAVNAAASAAAGRLETRPTDRADLAAALLAVVADEDATDELARGRLLEVPVPDAFGLGLAAPTPRAAPKKAPPKAKAKAAPSDRPPDQLAIRRATKRQKEAAKEADAASRALARAEKAADAEDEALEEAEEETARATTAVSEAEAALAQAKADLERAEDAAAQVVDTRDRAAALLAEAHERAEAADAELDEATAELEELET